MLNRLFDTLKVPARLFHRQRKLAGSKVLPAIDSPPKPESIKPEERQAVIESTLPVNAA